MAKESSNIYLDYLDKEMTIMGILSTFCVIVSGGALDRITGTENKFFELVWLSGSPYIILGSVFALLAALFFYLQRSLLAWYYGQISLCIAKKNEAGVNKNRKDKNQDEYSLEDWYAGADSWPTWIRYNAAFGFLILAFLEYGLGLISNKYSFINCHRFALAICPFLVMLPFYLFWFYLLVKFPNEDNPWAAFRNKNIRKK